MYQRLSQSVLKNASQPTQIWYLVMGILFDSDTFFRFFTLLKENAPQSNQILMEFSQKIIFFEIESSCIWRKRSSVWILPENFWRFCINNNYTIIWNLFRFTQGILEATTNPAKGHIFDKSYDTLFFRFR